MSQIDMKRLPLWFGLFLAGLVLASLVSVARAHEGAARLELSASRLNPGATLEVRGINLGADQPVIIVLVGADAKWHLGATVGELRRY